MNAPESSKTILIAQKILSLFYFDLKNSITIDKSNFDVVPVFSSLDHFLKTKNGWIRI